MTQPEKHIIYIRQAVPGGTDNYCKALYRMFRDDTSCRSMPIEDYPTLPSRLFHYYYKPTPLKNAIRQAGVVHINGYTAFGTIQALFYARRMKKRVVYTAHWHPFRHLRHPKAGRLFFCMLKSFIRHCADAVVTINEEDTGFFRSFHPCVVQIPHWLTMSPPDSTVERKKDMILFVGRLNDPVKGIEHLYHLPIGKYEVHCVGPGKVERSDFIHYPSVAQDELRDLYRQAALVVIPSKYEAFSYVALEALWNGTPVLMSNNVRIADYLRGVSGHSIFRYGSYDEFLAAIDSCMEQKVDTERVKAIFDPRLIKQKYSHVYNAG